MTGSKDLIDVSESDPGSVVVKCVCGVLNLTTWADDTFVCKDCGRSPTWGILHWNKRKEDKRKKV